MGWSVDRTFHFYLFIYLFIYYLFIHSFIYLFIYLFIYFDWREKSQPWTQVPIDKSVEERKN